MKTLTVRLWITNPEKVINRGIEWADVAANTCGQSLEDLGWIKIDEIDVEISDHVMSKMYGAASEKLDLEEQRLRSALEVVLNHKAEMRAITCDGGTIE